MRHGKKPEVIEKIQTVLWSTKKRKIITSATAGAVVLALIIGGIYFAVNPGSESTPEKTLEAPVREEFTEEDLEGVISGLEDHYILENSADIDYLHDVQANEDIVVNVDVDDSGIKLDNPGKYTVTYTVTVDTDRLQEYIDTGSTSKESESTGDSDNGSEETVVPDEIEEDDTKDTTEIVIEKEIEVVDEETAKDLANQGEIVWTDNSETLPKDDGTVTPTPEPEKPVENATTPAPSGTSSSNSSSNTSSSGNSSTGNSSSSGSSSGTSGSSTGNSSGSSNSSSSGNTSKPAHQHSWVEQGYYRTVEVEPAVYETKIVCSDGKIYDNVDDAILHVAEFGGNYSSQQIKVKDAVTEQQWVSTGYKCSGCGATK